VLVAAELEMPPQVFERLAEDVSAAEILGSGVEGMRARTRRAFIGGEMMKTVSATLCIAAALAVSTGGASVRAEDLSLSGSSQFPAVPSKLSRDINSAAGHPADKPSTDVEAQIRDLEASRAAVDQRKTAPISLSVSGSIIQEFQYNVGR